MGALRVVQRGWAFASIAGVGVTLGLVFASPAHARPSAAVQKCDPDAPPTEAVIAACSAALQDSAMQPPARAHLMLARGLAEQQTGKEADAIADFSQVIDIDSQKAQVVAKSRGDPDSYHQTDGRNLYLAVLKSDLATAYVNRGELYSAGGDIDGAKADLTEAIRLDPEWAAGYLRRSDVDAQVGDVTAAIADADRAEQLDANGALAWNSRCWARAVGNVDLDAAQEACERALKLAPSGTAHADALDSRAMVRYRLGQFDLAVADEDAALAALPDNPSYHFLRGLAEERLGKAAAGRADIEAALSADPKIADRYARWGLKPD